MSLSTSINTSCCVIVKCFLRQNHEKKSIYLMNFRTFHRTFATCAACQQRMLTPLDTWSCPILGLASVLMLRPISPELVLFPDFEFDCLCIDFYDISAWCGCWFVVYIRRFIYKFLNVCPSDYTAVAGEWEGGPVNWLTTPVGWL